MSGNDPSTRSAPPVAARAGAARRRIVSLDVARGLFLVVSVASASVIAPVPDWLKHPAWFGVTPYDLIFPLFVTLSGIGLAFAYRRRTDPVRTLRRVVVLALVGVVYTALYSGHTDLDTLRLTGVLQLYAVLVAAAALLHLVVRSARGWAVLTLVAAAVGTLTFLWFASRCPTGVLTPSCNPSGVLDGALLGVHMYAQGERGHDPEGLVAIAGAFVTAAAGVTAGHLAMDARDGPGRAGLVRLAAWVVTCALAGLALAELVEPFKRLWTPGFALQSASLGLVIFTLTFAVLDVWLARRATGGALGVVIWPLVALGRNSLLVYFGSHLGAALLMRGGGSTSWAEQVGAALPRTTPQVGFVLVSLAVWWAVALVLHRHRLYVRP